MRAPDLLLRFSGHAMAAGLAIRERDLARFDAIRFNFAEGAPSSVRAAYRLALNEFNGVAGVQLVLEHFEAA